MCRAYISKIRYALFLALALGALISACIYPGSSLANVPNSQSDDVSLFPIKEKQQPSPPPSSHNPEDRVDLQADELIYNDTEQLIIANGNVEITQAGQILKADTVRYDLSKDKAIASGDVSLLQENGDIHFAQNLEFQQKLKEGFVEGLYSYLAEGARLTAEEGEQTEGGKRIIMRNASYTPCIPCQIKKDVPIREQLKTEETPAWALKADEVIHDKDDKRIIYRNATFNFQGLPIAYTPYFSHPDGSVSQKSGFLMPSFGFDSELGPNITNRYYYAIDQDKDATFGLLTSTNEVPLGLAEYRQRFNKAYIEFNASATSSDRLDRENGLNVRKDDSFRGHLFGEGLWDINNKWRAGFDVQTTTDDQFLRRYNISNDDVLETEIYAERFEKRDYFAVRGFGFQDLRISSKDIDQPDILPEITYSHVSDPGSTFGGRYSLDGSILSLRRAGEGQDVTRGLVQGGWRRQSVFPFGVVLDTQALARADIFNVRDRDIPPGATNRSDTETEGRLFAALHNILRYPFIKSFQTSQIIMEPLIALTLAPDINQRDDEIPNEDSQDVELDVTSIFNVNRFPGQDRIEDKSRVTYGLNSGIYGDKGSQARFFVGQSHTFDEKGSTFPEGSGLSEQDSDLVGRIGIQYQNDFDFEYSFQFDNDTFQSLRHEISSSLNLGRAGLNGRYFFSRGLEETSVDVGREQLRMNSFLWLDDDRNWRSRGGFTHDFAEDQGLRRAFLGLDFFNDCNCWNVSMTAIRDLTAEASGESSTEFLIQIGFKNLGTFGNAALR